MLQKKLLVDLNERSYPIYIGDDLIQKGEYLEEHCTSQILIVTNETVGPLYVDSLKRTLSSFCKSIHVVTLPDGEQYKNFEILNAIFDELLDKRFNRKCTLIALGGGVVGDMTGFAAASYQRGVSFVQVPTTLLSQVDSSVGGKTGINHPLGKNMIGAFYQPKCVLIDTNVLNTLPRRELAAGMAEVIKYGFIYDSQFLRWLEVNMSGLMAGDQSLLAKAAERSCEIKAEIVAKDELEGGLRAILNLGHTFGHAIESAQGYGNWLHGEAVGCGMLMAADLSCRLGQITNEDLQRVKEIVESAELPVSVPTDMSPDIFIQYMSVDKKNLGSTIRLVLLKNLGSAYITDDYPREALQATLESFCNM